MISKFRFLIAPFIFVLAIQFPSRVNSQIALDCSKLDMTMVVQFLNDAFPLQMHSHFSNLKRLEYCAINGVYTKEELLELTDRQIFLVGTSSNLLETFQNTGISAQLDISKYQADLNAALAGLIEYGKSIKALAKEKTEKTQKDVEVARKKSAKLISVVTSDDREEK